MLLFSVYWLRVQAANTFFNLFRGVHESRHILQKDNPVASDIMSEKVSCRQPVHLFQGYNCKVHEKPDKKYKMKHEHFDPGAVRTDSQPADPVAELERMREQPDFIKVQKQSQDYKEKHGSR